MYRYISILLFICLGCNDIEVFSDKHCSNSTCNHFDDTDFEEFELLNSNYFEDRDTIYIPDNLKSIDNFLKENVDKTIFFKRKTYSLDPFRLNSNQQLIIPYGAYIKLDDQANLPFKGGYFIAAEGSFDKRLDNVKLLINGTLDGNKKIHSYDKSGNEGVTFRFIDNSYIGGSGTIRNFSGDGIDIDYATNLIIN